MALSGGFLIGLFFLSDWLPPRNRQLGDQESRRYVVFGDHRALSIRLSRALAHFRTRQRVSVTFERATSTDETLRNWSPLRRRSSAGTSWRDHSSSSGRSDCRNYIEGGIPLGRDGHLRL
jgi:hypothetical protein